MRLPFDLMVDRPDYASWLAFLKTVRTERFNEILFVGSAVEALPRAAPPEANAVPKESVAHILTRLVGRPPRPLRHIPDGRGRGAKRSVRGYSEADRRAAGKSKSSQSQAKRVAA